MKPANPIQQSLVRRHQQVEALMTALAAFLKVNGLPVELVQGVRELLKTSEKSLVEIQKQLVHETWGREY